MFLLLEIQTKAKGNYSNVAEALKASTCISLFLGEVTRASVKCAVVMGPGCCFRGMRTVGGPWWTETGCGE